MSSHQKPVWRKKESQQVSTTTSSTSHQQLVRPQILCGDAAFEMVKPGRDQHQISNLAVYDDPSVSSEPIWYVNQHSGTSKCVVDAMHVDITLEDWSKELEDPWDSKHKVELGENQLKADVRLVLTGLVVEACNLHKSGKFHGDLRNMKNYLLRFGQDGKRVEVILMNMKEEACKFNAPNVVHKGIVEDLKQLDALLIEDIMKLKQNDPYPAYWKDLHRLMTSRIAPKFLGLIVYKISNHPALMSLDENRESYSETWFSYKNGKGKMCRSTFRHRFENLPLIRDANHWGDITGWKTRIRSGPFLELLNDKGPEGDRSYHDDALGLCKYGREVFRHIDDDVDDKEEVTPSPSSRHQMVAGTHSPSSSIVGSSRDSPGQRPSRNPSGSPSPSSSSAWFPRDSAGQRLSRNPSGSPSPSSSSVWLPRDSSGQRLSRNPSGSPSPSSSSVWLPRGSASQPPIRNPAHQNVTRSHSPAAGTHLPPGQNAISRNPSPLSGQNVSPPSERVRKRKKYYDENDPEESRYGDPRYVEKAFRDLFPELVVQAYHATILAIDKTQKLSQSGRGGHR